MTPLQLGAAVGAVAMAATSSGDVLLLGVLLGLVAADVFAGTAAVLAGVAVLGRWGSSSLAALAGGQAVVGGAGWAGPGLMVASTWAAAAALLLAAPTGAVPAVAFGLAAANVAAGPAPGGLVAARVGASAVAVVALYVVGGRLPRRQTRFAAPIVALAAALLTLPK